MATSKMTTEARSAAQSIRAKLRKALAVDGFDLQAAEQKSLDSIIARITKAIVPPKAAKKAAKKSGKGKGKGKGKAKTAAKPATTDSK